MSALLSASTRTSRALAGGRSAARNRGRVDAYAARRAAAATSTRSISPTTRWARVKLAPLVFGSMIKSRAGDGGGDQLFLPRSQPLRAEVRSARRGRARDRRRGGADRRQAHRRSRRRAAVSHDLDTFSLLSDDERSAPRRHRRGHAVCSRRSRSSRSARSPIPIARPSSASSSCSSARRPQARGS